MKVGDKITYTYIKRIKKWMECPVCHQKMTFKKTEKAWKCNSCSYYIPEADFLDDFVFWFCDGCGEYLNIQKGFDRNEEEWICTKCGFKNNTTFSNIKGECKDCGKILDNPDATICSDCKIIRMNNPVSVSLLSGDRKPQICFLGNHHSGDGNLYHKSFRM